MTYKDRLHCWAIARLLPSHQWMIVACFRSRSDAEGHFKFLRQTRGIAEIRACIGHDVFIREL
ncbi:hypothetical protein [Microcoleus sp. F4-D5]|uniref:hypothetical protein n=1 Tax=Microcoleus sp. F4-D5 TaxID=2818760 RepID=UPI002FD1BEF3